MSLDQSIQYLSWAIYLVIFVVVTARAVRRPLRANLDIALLFGTAAAIIAFTVAISLNLVASRGLSGAFVISLLLLMIYMLLRLVDDFSEVPAWLMLASTAALALCVIGSFAFAFAPPQPGWFSMLELVYILGLLFYTLPAFMAETRRSSGVTRRRLIAVTLGSAWLCVIFLLLGVELFFPSLAPSLAPLSGLIGLASGVCYFIGFATPTVLRRAWQEPELRAFLGRAASLPRLPDTESIVKELERGAATSVGAPNATITLWDEAAQVIKLRFGDTRMDLPPTDSTISGRVFLTQEPVFTPEIKLENPTYEIARKTFGATAVLAAPITAGAKRLGVLMVYAPHTPIFAEEDLALVQLLADQAAVILESRALIDEAARVQAREEVTRLKEDFLSAAAHDLKTPLTTLVALTELMERRALRAPDAPTDVVSLQKLKREAYRLKSLVLELLDAARTEQGKLVGEREPIDLVSVALDVCERHHTERHPCTVEGEGPVIGVYDPNRIMQLLENLVENAIKYSPDGGPVRVKVWGQKELNHLTVTDSGIGIPREDLSNVFERFHRGTNVDDRRFAGMGLGLFICRGIAEQHGGRIWVESAAGAANNGSGEHSGSTFHVALPAAAPAASPAGATMDAEGSRQGQPVG
jgi:signal transduction histidine kinase